MGLGGNVLDNGMKLIILYIFCGTVTAIFVLNLIVHCTTKDRQQISKASWKSPIVRPTIPNWFSICHMFFYSLQLICLFSLTLEKPVLPASLVNPVLFRPIPAGDLDDRTIAEM